MSYYLKLKDPRWQKKRLEILQRDEFCCNYCGDEESELHVHHHYYVYGKEIWDYEDDALSTLCSKCHNLETERIRITKENLRGFKDQRLKFLTQLITCCTVFDTSEINELVQLGTKILDRKGIEYEYENENDRNV